MSSPAMADVTNIKSPELDNSTVQGLGDSSSTVHGLGNTSSTVQGLGDTSSTVQGLGNTSSTVQGLGNTSSTVQDLGDTSSTVQDLGNTSSTVQDLEDTSSTVQGLGDTSSTVQDLEDTSSTVQGLGDTSSTVQDLGDSSSTLQDLGESSSTVQGLVDTTSTVQDLGDSSSTVQGLGDTTSTVQDLGDSSSTVQGLRDTSSTVQNLGDDAQVEDGNDSEQTDIIDKKGHDVKKSYSMVGLCIAANGQGCVDINTEICLTSKIGETSSEENVSNDDPKDSITHIVKMCLDSVISRVLLACSADDHIDPTDNVGMKTNAVSQDVPRNVSEDQDDPLQDTPDTEYQLIKECMEHVISKVLEIGVEAIATQRCGVQSFNALPEDRIVTEMCVIDLEQGNPRELTSVEMGGTTSSEIASPASQVRDAGAKSEILMPHPLAMAAEEVEARKECSGESTPTCAPQMVDDMPPTEDEMDISCVEEDVASSRSQSALSASRDTGVEKGRISIGYSKKKDKYKCFLCAEVGTDRMFEEHVMQHLLWKPYKCLYCSKFFLTRTAIGTHVSNIHTGQLPRCGLRAIKKAKQFMAEARKRGTCEYILEKLNDLYWTSKRTKEKGEKSGMESMEMDQDDHDTKKGGCETTSNEALSSSMLTLSSPEEPEDQTFESSDTNETKRTCEMQSIPKNSNNDPPQKHVKSNDPFLPIVVPDTGIATSLESPGTETHAMHSPLGNPKVSPVSSGVQSLAKISSLANNLTKYAKSNEPDVPIIVPDDDVKTTHALPSPIVGSPQASPVILDARSVATVLSPLKGCVPITLVPCSPEVAHRLLLQTKQLGATRVDTTKICGTNMVTIPRIFQRLPVLQSPTATVSLPTSNPPVLSSSQIVATSPVLKKATSVVLTSPQCVPVLVPAEIVASSVPSSVTVVSHAQSRHFVPMLPTLQAAAKAPVSVIVRSFTSRCPPVLPFPHTGIVTNAPVLKSPAPAGVPSKIPHGTSNCRIIVLQGSPMLNILPQTGNVNKNMTTVCSVSSQQLKQDSTVSANTIAVQTINTLNQVARATSEITLNQQVVHLSTDCVGKTTTYSLPSQTSSKGECKQIYPKNFAIGMMNDDFLCILCKTRYVHEHSFRAHLWNHLHTGNTRCSQCHVLLSEQTRRTLTCRKTEKYIENLKRSKVGHSSVIEVQLDEGIASRRASACDQPQEECVGQQATTQASADGIEQVTGGGYVAEPNLQMSSGVLANQSSASSHGEQIRRGTGILPGKTKDVLDQEAMLCHHGNVRECVQMSEGIQSESMARAFPKTQLHSEMPAKNSSDCVDNIASSHTGQDSSSAVPPERPVQPTEWKFYMCGAACGFSTLFGSELKKHAEECNLPGALVCSHCKFPAGDPDALAKHMSRHYIAHLPGIAVLQCSVHGCTFTTNILQGFVQHMSNVHVNLDTYVCNLCGENFPDLAPLIKHLHSNILHIVNCKYCSAKDCSKAVIIKHIIESHQEKPMVTNMVKHLLCKDKIENAARSETLFSNARVSMLANATTTDNSRGDYIERVCPLPGDGGHWRTSDKPKTLSAFVPTTVDPSTEPRHEMTIFEVEQAAQLHAKHCPEDTNVTNPRDVQQLNCSSEKSLTCQLCSFVGISVSELYIHSSKHKAKSAVRMLSYSCPECPEDFNLLDSFQTHLRKHNQMIRYDICCCQICQIQKGSRKNVMNHIKTVHHPIGEGHEFVDCVFRVSNSDVVKCPSCDYVCLGKEAMSMHRRGQFSALSSCGARPSSERALAAPARSASSELVGSDMSQEKRKYSPEEEERSRRKVNMSIPSNSVYKYPVRCVQCTYSSVYKTNLQRHVDKNHPEVNVVLEDGVMASPTTLRKISRGVPNDGNEFQESDVDKFKIGGSFLAKELEWLYEDHGSSYRCLKCFKCFKKRNIVHTHVLSHWNISLWKCAVCMYNHAQRILVIEHMQQEHNEDCDMDDVIPMIDGLKKDISSILGSLIENGKEVHDARPSLGTKVLDGELRCLYHTRGNKKLCKGCNAEYQSVYDIHTHILKTHLEIYLFNCKHCTFSALERFSVVQHIVNEHPQREITVCFQSSITDKIKSRIKDKKSSTKKSKKSKRGNRRSDTSRSSSERRTLENRNTTDNVEYKCHSSKKTIARIDGLQDDNACLQGNEIPTGASSRCLSKTVGDSNNDCHELRVGSNTLDQKLQTLYTGKSSKSPKMVCKTCQQNFPSKYSLHCHLLGHMKVSLLACPYCSFQQVEKSKVIGHIKKEHPHDLLHLRHIKVDIDEAVREFLGARSENSKKRKSHKKTFALSQLLPRCSSKSLSKSSKSPEKGLRSVVAVKVGKLMKYKCKLCDYMALTKKSVVGHVSRVHEQQHTRKRMLDNATDTREKSKDVSPEDGGEKGKVGSSLTQDDKNEHVPARTTAVEKVSGDRTELQVVKKHQEHNISADTSAESSRTSGVKERKRKVSFDDGKSNDRHLAKKSKLEKEDISVPFRCPKCAFTDSRRKTILLHMKSLHGVTMVLLCRYCDAWFFTKDNLKGHISFLHKGKDIQYKDKRLGDVAFYKHSKDVSSDMAVKRASGEIIDPKGHANTDTNTSVGESKSTSKAKDTSIKPASHEMDPLPSSKEKGLSCEEPVVHKKSGSKCIEKDCKSLKPPDSPLQSPPMKDALGEFSEPNTHVMRSSGLSLCVPSCPDNNDDEHSEFYLYLCVYCDFKLNSRSDMMYHIAEHLTHRLFEGNVPVAEEDKEKIKKKVQAILPICKERAKNKLVTVSASHVGKEDDNTSAVPNLASHSDRVVSISDSQTTSVVTKLSVDQKRKSLPTVGKSNTSEEIDPFTCSTDVDSDSDGSEVIQPRRINRKRRITSSSEDEEPTTSKKKCLVPSKSTYCCHLCPLTATSLYQYRAHLAAHGGFTHLNPDISTGAMLKCGFCGFLAESKELFTRHVETHLTGGIYKCGYCKFDSYHRKNMRSHLNCRHRHKPEKFVDLRVLMRERALRPSEEAQLVNLDPQLRLVDSMTSLQFKRLLDEAGCETMSMPLSVVKVVYRLIGENIEGFSMDELDMT